MREEAVREACQTSLTYAAATGKLGIPGQTGTIKKWIAEYDIDVSHFTQKKGSKYPIVTKECPVCGCTFTYKQTKFNTNQLTCSISCSNSFKPKRKKMPKPPKIKKVIKSKTKGTVVKYITPYKRRDYDCTWCGTISKKKNCSDRCRHEKRQFKSLAIFGFNDGAIGTVAVHDEFNRVVEFIKTEYYDNEMSLPDLCKKYNYPDPGTLGAFLKRGLNFELRNQSTAGSMAYKQGKIPIKDTFPNCKTGDHTTWDGRIVHYRSSYELDYYHILDKQKVYYLVEALRITYYDTVREKERTAIPDIFIPDDNLIVEIKSNFTYNKQEMNDKFQSYEEKGYKTKLILDKEEV